MKRLFLCLLSLMLFLPAVYAEDATQAPVILVRAGGSFGMALDANGGIWGWGDNANGALGNGHNKRVYMPAKAAIDVDGTQVADIQCGNVSTLFLMKDGTVWTCGSNNYGQQGIEGVDNRLFHAQQIPTLQNIVQIACGFGQCLALDAEGHVWAWGRNSNSQLGNNNRKSVQVPFMIEGLENITSVQCGGKFCMAMDAEGNIWGWGDNEYGQLNDVTRFKNVPVPTLLPISGRFTQIACGGDCAFGVTPDGELYAWGRNDYWQLGDGKAKEKTVEPVRVQLPEGTVVSKVFAYNSHTGAITNTGALWQWGGVYHGQVGDGKRPWRQLPKAACPDSDVLDMAVGSLQSYVLLEDGTVMGCGCNEYGQTGAFHKMSYYVAKWMNTGLNLQNGTWEDPKN